jgi:hypothetical protein
VDRRVAAALSAGPPRGLAPGLRRGRLDGNHPLGHAGQRGDPGDKTTLELLGVEDRQDVAEMIVRRRAILERAEAAQKLAFLAAEQGNIDDGLGAGQHGEQAQEQDLVERVGYLALLARVFQVLEMAQKNHRLVECAIIRRRVSHGRPPASESRVAIDSALQRFVTYSFTRLPWWEIPALLTRMSIRP